MYKRVLLICFLLIISSLSVFADLNDPQNLREYFEYLPNAVHRNWTPFKTNHDYKIAVRFRIDKHGNISNPRVVESTYEKANVTALEAIKRGTPYKPLPKSFRGDGVEAQIELEYRAKGGNYKG